MGPNGRPGVESYVPVAAFYEGKRELAGEAFSDRFAVLEWNDVDLRVLAARGKDLAPGTVLPLSREDAACLRDAVRDGAAVLLPCGAILFGKAAEDGLIPALFPEGETDLLAQAVPLLGWPGLRTAPSLAENGPMNAKRAHAVSEVCRELAGSLARCERLFDPARAERFRAHCAEIAAFAGCRIDVGELPAGNYPLSRHDGRIWTLFLLCLFLSLRGASAQGPTLRMREESREMLLTGVDYRSNADSGKHDAERFAFLGHPAFADVKPEKTKEGYRFSILLRSGQTDVLRSVSMATRVHFALDVCTKTA